MKEVIPDASLANSLEPEGPIKEASSGIDSDKTCRSYDCDHFRVDQAERRYQNLYKGQKIIVERGIDVANMANHALRARMLLDTQGWTNMVKDHCLAIVEIVHKFYANIHRRSSDSF